MTFEFDILQTLTIATVVLFIGGFIKGRIRLLEKFFIPNPVIGGIIIALVALIGYSTGSFFFEFDTTLQTIFMTAFFTSVGFSCDLKAFARGGKLGFRLAIVIVLLITFQNILGVSLAKLLDINLLIGLSNSSVALTGGHGTSAAFGPVFEDLNAVGATTVALSAATFGLVSGGILGGPIARFLVKKHNLMATTDRTKSTKSEISSTKESEADEVLSTNKMFTAAYQIIIAMGIGTIISMFLENIGLIFPGYLGGLLMGLIIRNLGDYTNKFSIPKKEIDTIGEISLSLFISMALMTLKLWELKDLALPMLVILTVQVILIIFFTIYIAFRLLGKDYDSAVMVSGVVGFGLGAMPVAVANMQTLMKEHPASPSVFFVITAIGSLVIDISNSFLITFFMNLVS